MFLSCLIPRIKLNVRPKCELVHILLSNMKLLSFLLAVFFFYQSSALNYDGYQVILTTHLQS